MLSKSVLATTTNYHSLSDVRPTLALKTISAATKLGYDVIVVNGSAGPDFTPALTRAGATVFAQKGESMGASRREAFHHALDSGADIVIWTEPEKYPFIPFLGSLLHHVEMGTPHIIVPRRETLEGYPPYQQSSEEELNREIGSVTGRPDLDLSFGPRIFNKGAAHYFTEYRGEHRDRWESIFIPILRALHDGVRVDSITVPYIHPPEQTAAETADEEFNHKRDVQRKALIQALQAEAELLGYHVAPTHEN